MSVKNYLLFTLIGVCLFIIVERVWLKHANDQIHFDGALLQQNANESYLEFGDLEVIMPKLKSNGWEIEFIDLEEFNIHRTRIKKCIRTSVLVFYRYKNCFHATIEREAPQVVNYYLYQCYQLRPWISFARLLGQTEEQFYSGDFFPKTFLCGNINKDGEWKVNARRSKRTIATGRIENAY